MAKSVLGMVIGSAVTIGLAGAASAAVVTLNFEGIAPYPNSSDVLIQDFYNGGTSSIGTSGTNYGVHFDNSALLICLNSTLVICSNTSRGGLAPGSAEGALYFHSASSTTLDYAAGFTTGFSFNYSDPFVLGELIQVFSGAGGTGALLGSFSLALTPTGGCPSYGAYYCPFVASGVSFAGIAHSVVFGGVTNRVVFDDITFGASTPTVPEPAAWSVMLLGVAAVGAATRGKRKAVSATV